jgi:hypothetical protein
LAPLWHEIPNLLYQSGAKAPHSKEAHNTNCISACRLLA